MSARGRSKVVSIFVIIVIAMLLFSVMGVVVLYLKGPRVPAQTAGLTGSQPTPNTGQDDRILYQAPNAALVATGTTTGSLPAQTGATTGN